AKEPGLDRRRELEDGVAEGEMPELRAAQILGEPADERLPQVVDFREAAIDEENVEGPVRVLARERLGKHPGVGQGVVGDDGAGDRRGHRLRRNGGTNHLKWSSRI